MDVQYFAMKLVFYYTPMTSATRVHWALEELGIEYEKVKVDLKAGEQRRPEYLALNPNGKVPLLVVDGKPLFESLAQLLWLGETFGVDKGLYPPPGERLAAYQWMAWGSVSLIDAGSRLMRNVDPRWAAQHSAAAADAARGELADLFRVLDAALATNAYLLGGAFSLVDCAVAAGAGFVARLGFDAAPYAHVGAWLGRCMARPAFGRALAG
jgi:glutathione S-transferase